MLLKKLIFFSMLAFYQPICLANVYIAERNRPIDDLSRQLTQLHQYNASLGPNHWLPVSNCQHSNRLFTTLTHSRDPLPRGYYIDSRNISTSGQQVRCVVRHQKSGAIASFHAIGTKTIYED